MECRGKAADFIVIVDLASQDNTSPTTQRTTTIFDDSSSLLICTLDSKRQLEAFSYSASLITTEVSGDQFPYHDVQHRLVVFGPPPCLRLCSIRLSNHILFAVPEAESRSVESVVGPCAYTDSS
jgi:hypothetical protein